MIVPQRISKWSIDSVVAVVFFCFCCSTLTELSEKRNLCFAVFDSINEHAFFTLNLDEQCFLPLLLYLFLTGRDVARILAKCE